MIRTFNIDTDSNCRPSLVAFDYFPVFVIAYLKKKFFAHLAKNLINRKQHKNVLNKIPDLTPTKNIYFGVEKPGEISKTP